MYSHAIWKWGTVLPSVPLACHRWIAGPCFLEACSSVHSPVSGSKEAIVSMTNLLLWHSNPWIMALGEHSPAPVFLQLLWLCDGIRDRSCPRGSPLSCPQPITSAISPSNYTVRTKTPEENAFLLYNSCSSLFWTLAERGFVLCTW